jgi:hypothetical protein
MAAQELGELRCRAGAQADAEARMRKSTAQGAQDAGLPHRAIDAPLSSSGGSGHLSRATRIRVFLLVS